MDVNTIPRDFVPQTYAEAVLFAQRWYHDSGFNAFLEGFRHGSGTTIPDQITDRHKLVKWARREVESNGS